MTDPSLVPYALRHPQQQTRLDDVYANVCATRDLDVLKAVLHHTKVRAGKQTFPLHFLEKEVPWDVMIQTLVNVQWKDGLVELLDFANNNSMEGMVWPRVLALSHGSVLFEAVVSEFSAQPHTDRHFPAFTQLMLSAISSDRPQLMGRVMQWFERIKQPQQNFDYILGDQAPLNDALVQSAAIWPLETLHTLIPRGQRQLVLGRVIEAWSLAQFTTWWDKQQWTPVRELDQIPAPEMELVIDLLSGLRSGGASPQLLTYLVQSPPLNNWMTFPWDDETHMKHGAVMLKRNLFQVFHGALRLCLNQDKDDQQAVRWFNLADQFCGTVPALSYTSPSSKPSLTNVAGASLPHIGDVFFSHNWAVLADLHAQRPQRLEQLLGAFVSQRCERLNASFVHSIEQAIPKLPPGLQDVLVGEPRLTAASPLLVALAQNRQLHQVVDAQQAPGGTRSKRVL